MGGMPTSTRSVGRQSTYVHANSTQLCVLYDQMLPRLTSLSGAESAPNPPMHGGLLLVLREGSMLGDTNGESRTLYGSTRYGSTPYGSTPVRDYASHHAQVIREYEHGSKSTRIPTGLYGPQGSGKGTGGVLRCSGCFALLRRSTGRVIESWPCPRTAGLILRTALAARAACWCCLGSGLRHLLCAWVCHSQKDTWD